MIIIDLEIVIIDHNLSGWWFEPTPLKNMKVSWRIVGVMKFPTAWKNKTCSKPPTSFYS